MATGCPPPFLSSFQKNGWFFGVPGSHQGSWKEVFFFNLSGDLFFGVTIPESNILY